MLRNLLTIASRVGRPGTLLRVGDSTGRVLYLEAAMSPVSVIVGLERDDVKQLHAVLGSWLAEREDTPPVRRGPAPLVAGRIGRAVQDAGTVQVRTVNAADQH